MRKQIECYNGNKKLKSPSVEIQYTNQQINEYIKCSTDPIYFIKNYVKVVHVDRGTVPFALYGYQERIINAYHANRKVIVLAPRQMGKTVSTAAYFLWVVLFNADKNVAILANKAVVAREILSKIKYAFECLPKWLQMGVVEWNKGSIELENGSSIITAATSPTAIRGFSCSHIYVDELAFVPVNVAEEFMTSIFPVISSGKETKIFLSSTPNGINIFHKSWVEAETGISGFTPVKVTWNENPDRDLDWLADQRKNLGEVKFHQEIFCQFNGSSYTLISGTALSKISTTLPIFEQDNLKVWEHPEKGHTYVCTVDVSEGVHMDYSAMVVFDITEMPYRVVATFKDNTISSLSYPFLIYQLAIKYNNAYVLIETNNVGGEVANTLLYELEYEHVYYTHKETLNEGMGHPGVRTTKKVKAVGTACLRELVEQDQLTINSHDILAELSVFVKKNASYASSDPNGVNDDLTSCLWLFSWLTKQQLFTDLTNTNIRAILAKKTEENITENLIPFGILSDGHDDLFEDDVSSITLNTSNMESQLERWAFSSPIND